MEPDKSTSGKVWISPTGAPIEDFPEGWTEVGNVSGGGYTTKITDEQLYWDDPYWAANTSISFPLDPLFAEWMRELLEEPESEEQ